MTLPVSQLQHKRALKRLKLNIQPCSEICIYANTTLQNAPVTTAAPHVCVPGTFVLYCVPCFLMKCSHSLILADPKRVTDLTSVLGFVLGIFIDVFGEMNGRQGNANV